MISPWSLLLSSCHRFPTWVSSSPALHSHPPAFSGSRSQGFLPLDASHQHQQPNISVVSIHTAWTDFAENVSGEWDGYQAEFSPSGVPFELPSSVVPEEFHVWGVKIHDWQTQSPTLAEKNKKAIKYKIVKLLPTVGCEAGAATPYIVGERVIKDKDAEFNTLGFHISGSYVAVFYQEKKLREHVDSNRHAILEVEHCLVEERDRTFRVRIFLQIIMKEKESKERFDPVLNKITVQREKRVSGFKNGGFLGGYLTSGSAFASTCPMQISELEGTWHAENYSATWEPYGETFQHLTCEGMEVLERIFEQNFIALPAGLWCEFGSTSGNQIFTGAGWLVNPTTSFALKCELAGDGKLKRVLFRFQKRHKEVT